MSQTYDFWVNGVGSGLGFNKYIKADEPYERATAQFRKDQFDSQQTVGDQSLTGWWVRGQQSFHKGGGVLYHEVQGSESIIDRFDSAQGIDPFTPGQATLGHGLDELATTGISVEDCVYVFHLSLGDRIVARATNGNAYQITVDSPWSSQTVTQITTATAASVAAIASSRYKAFLAVGKNIEVWDVSTGSSSVLWTGTGAWDILGLWYAKQRLWAVDANGNWYVLDTAGGSFAEVDAKFTIKDYNAFVATWRTFRLAETPGPVLISAFNEVYSVSVTYASGSLLPTIDAPVLVAELPGDEFISCIYYHLGYVAIATYVGVRFAAIGNDGLVYGPRITGTNFTDVRRIDAKGTRVCMGGAFVTEVGVWSFDLGQMVDNLQPAWTLEMTASGDSMTGTGALATPAGLVMWASSRQKIYRENSSYYLPSGNLGSGFHRFGTLDPKHFQSVLVRAGGSGGTIDVYRRDPASTVPYYVDTLVGSVNYNSDAELDLGLSAPTERVGLRFTLNRDSSDSSKAPILLGYQLKALPLPKRQRMIRIPLMLFDYESDRTGQKRGGQGQAWTRLAALEALEESNAVVTFNDTETGESGSAYIEAVEVRRTAPTSRDNDGFGGLVYLTLRKIG